MFSNHNTYYQPARYGYSAHRQIPTNVQKSATKAGIHVRMGEKGQYALTAQDPEVLQRLIPSNIKGRKHDSFTTDLPDLKRALHFIHQPLRSSLGEDTNIDEKYLVLRRLFDFVTKSSALPVKTQKHEAADDHIQIEEDLIADMHQKLETETDGKAVPGFRLDAEDGYYVLVPGDRMRQADGYPGKNQNELKALFQQLLNESCDQRYANELPAELKLTGAELEALCQKLNAHDADLPALLKEAKFEEDVQKHRREILTAATKISGFLSPQPGVNDLLRCTSSLTAILESNVTRDMRRRYHWWDSVRNSVANPAEKLAYDMKVFHATLASLPAHVDPKILRATMEEFAPLIDFSHQMLQVLKTAAEPKKSEKPALEDVGNLSAELERLDQAFIQAMSAAGPSDPDDEAEAVLRDLRIYTGQRRPQTIGPIYSSMQDFLKEALEGAQKRPIITAALTYLILQTLPGSSPADVANVQAAAQNAVDPATGELILGNLNNIKDLPDAFKVFSACHWNYSIASSEYYPHCISSDQFVKSYNAFYEFLGKAFQFLPRSAMTTLMDMRGPDHERFLFGNRFIEGLDYMGRKLTGINRYQDLLHAGFWSTMYILGNKLGVRNAVRRLDTFLSPIINLAATTGRSIASPLDRITPYINSAVSTVRRKPTVVFNLLAKPSPQSIVLQATRSEKSSMPVYEQTFETSINADMTRFYPEEFKEAPVRLSGLVAKNLWSAPKEKIAAGISSAWGVTAGFTSRHKWLVGGTIATTGLVVLSSATAGYFGQFPQFGPHWGPALENMSGTLGTWTGYTSAITVFGPMNVVQDIVQNHMGIGAVAAAVGATAATAQGWVRPAYRNSVEFVNYNTGGVLGRAWHSGKNKLHRVKTVFKGSVDNVDQSLGLAAVKMKRSVFETRADLQQEI